MPGPALSQLDIARVIEAHYIEKKTWAQVASHYGIAPKTLMRLRKSEEFQATLEELQRETFDELSKQLLFCGSAALMRLAEICANSKNEPCAVAAARTIMDKLFATKLDADITDSARARAYQAALLVTAEEMRKSGEGIPSSN